MKEKKLKIQKKKIVKIIENHFQITLPSDAERCADDILEIFNNKIK